MQALSYVAQAAGQPQPIQGTAAVLLGAAIFVIALASALQVLSYWIVLRKAGRKGWEAAVPIYESWVRYELSGKPGWWALLGLLPVVGLVVTIIGMKEFCRRFDKGTAFAVMTAVLPAIGFTILAFGDAQYDDPDKPAAQRFKAKWRHNPHLP